MARSTPPSTKKTATAPSLPQPTARSKGKAELALAATSLVNLSMSFLENRPVSLDVLRDYRKRMQNYIEL